VISGIRRMCAELKRGHLRLIRLSTVWCLLCGACVVSSSAQEKTADPVPPPAQSDALKVNWLYGAYIPKDMPLVALTEHQRRKLFLRQTFTSPGIYVKTLLFSLGDQIDNSPPDWGGGIGGYASRAASRQGQFVIQNAFSTAGNALLQYEPRYDRCRCTGFWPRTGHALKRNFVTYNKTETEMRPQIALYGAAFAAGMVSSTWKPKHEVWAEGYRSVITQAGFGLLTNWVGEFAPEIIRVVRRQKTEGPKN
jgi:hypothetical protein